LPGRARLASSADTRAPNGHGRFPNDTHTHATTVTTASAFRHAPAEAGPAVRGGVRRGLRASRAISGGNRSVGYGFFTAEAAEGAEMSDFSDFCGVR